MHPERKTKDSFASILKGNLNKAMEDGEHALIVRAMARLKNDWKIRFEIDKNVDNKKDAL